MNEPLTDVPELAAMLPNVRVVDARWRLGNPSAGRELFEAGHIPGAVHLDMDRDLAAAPGIGGRHPLPSPEAFAKAMSRAGIGPGTRVVAYDDGDGLGAARLWWELRHFGHDNVAVLDGGIKAWQAAGQPVESGPGTAPSPAKFDARARTDDVLDTEEVRQALAAGTIHLLDARAPERWRGEVEPVDPKPGRIPGSINAPAGANLEGGHLRAPDALQAQYGQLGVLDGKPIVASCGSGVSACVDLLALEVAGVRGAKLYPGSYSGWLANGLPEEKG
jgi:thiosulfate/3-mercaptopyruvate sulfurtransferase